jgi:8-oxo-dGTP diphosphatase
MSGRLDGVHTGRLPCAGGIIFDSNRRLLIVRRLNPPSAGKWSIPGGKSLIGEAPQETCVREVREETGLDVSVLTLAGRVVRDGPPGIQFDIADYVCAVIGGVLRPGDDAGEARWVTRAQFDELDLAPGLYDALASWNALPD